MSSTNQDVSRVVILTMAFQHSNFAFVKLITILTQQYHGIDLKRFWWGDQMMEKIGMHCTLSINKPLPMNLLHS
jgi:hypothetical protein